MDTDAWVADILSKIKFPVSKPEDIILEPGLIASCRPCEQEFGVNQKTLQHAGWMVSHQNCLRHLPQRVAMWGKEEPKYGQAVKKFLIQAIQRITANHWKGEPRDLSRPENKAVLQWLKNPTPAQQPSTI